jgi:hypothetical protein
VSSRSTFDELVKWFREIETYCGEGVVKMVVGNKVDKVSDRMIWFISIRRASIGQHMTKHHKHGRQSSSLTGVLAYGPRLPPFGASALTSQEFSRQVTTDEGKAFADRMGTLFIGMSGRRHAL